MGKVEEIRRASNDGLNGSVASVTNFAYSAAMSRLTTALNLLACAVLASCASSTMDSIPSVEQMQIYKEQAQRDMQPDYLRLADMRHSKELTDSQYFAEVALLDERAVARAHTIAWNQHNMAEMDRQAQGIPTPAAPVMNMAPNAMNGGAGGGSMYRSYQQQFNSAAGVGGGNTLSPGQMQSRMSTQGGALSRQNFPGSIYDDPTYNQ